MRMSRSHVIVSQWSVITATHIIAVALMVSSRVTKRKIIGGGVVHVDDDGFASTGLPSGATEARD